MWEENLPAVELFVFLDSQWRVAVGMSGVIYMGIDFTAAVSTMHARRVPARDRGRMLDDLRSMANEAAKFMNARNDG